VYARILAGEHPAFTPRVREVTLYYRHGFARHLDNHEFVSRYVGLTREQVDAEHRVAIELPPAELPPVEQPRSAAEVVA
jgi:hypothetical protein